MAYILLKLQTLQHYIFLYFLMHLLILGRNIAYFHLGVYLILMTLLMSAVRLQISRKLYKTITNLYIYIY